MNRHASSVLAAAVVAALVLGGCGGGEEYGTMTSNRGPTALSSIVGDPVVFEGMEVTVTGEIVNECPTGCWFDLRQKGVEIRVDLAPYGLAIPQRVGGTATVEGTVVVSDGRPVVHGRGVMIE